MGGTSFGPCYGDGSVYDALEYVDVAGNETQGSTATLAIRDECVLGSRDSVPVNLGCPAEAQAALACSRDCPPETLQALSDCVVDCVQDVVERATGNTLSDECIECYGVEASCSVVSCALYRCIFETSPACIQCRCSNECTTDFEQCSGVPPSGDCG